MTLKLVKASTKYRQQIIDMLQEWIAYNNTSERRNGYATQMVCSKDNVGSVKSITNNGGILENEIVNQGKIQQRYWIDLSGWKEDKA